MAECAEDSSSSTDNGDRDVRLSLLQEHKEKEKMEKTPAESKEDITIAPEEKVPPHPFRDPTVSKKSKQYLLIKSICLVMVWVCLGLSQNITSPALPDLKYRAGGKYDNAGWAVSFLGIGVMFGSVFGALISDLIFLKSDIIIAVAMIMDGVSVVFKPWVNSLEALAALFFLQGLPHGCINAVGNAMMIGLWGKYAASPLHFMHFGHGLGSTIIPLITRPFLSPDIIDSDSNSTFFTSTTAQAMTTRAMTSVTMTTEMSNATTEHVLNDRLEIPYAIVGTIMFAVGIAFVIFQMIGIPKDINLTRSSKTLKELWSPASCAGGDTCFGVGIMTMLILFYFGAKGKDNTMDTFLFSFAVEGKLKFTKQEAAVLDSVFNGTYTFGRILGGIISVFVPIQIMLVSEVFLILGSMTGLALVGTTSRTWIWVFVSAFGVTSGPIWPSGYSWANRYIVVYALVVALIDVGTGAAGFIVVALSGYLFQNVGPLSVMYASLASASLMCVMVIVMQIFASRHGDRHKKQSYNMDADTDKEIEATSQL